MYHNLIDFFCAALYTPILFPLSLCLPRGQYSIEAEKEKDGPHRATLTRIILIYRLGVHEKYISSAVHTATNLFFINRVCVCAFEYSRSTNPSLARRRPDISAGASIDHTLIDYFCSIPMIFDISESFIEKFIFDDKLHGYEKTSFFLAAPRSQSNS